MVNGEFTVEHLSSKRNIFLDFIALLFSSSNFYLKIHSSFSCSIISPDLNFKLRRFCLYLKSRHILFVFNWKGCEQRNSRQTTFYYVFHSLTYILDACLTTHIPGVPGIVTFINKNIEPQIFQDSLTLTKQLSCW